MTSPIVSKILDYIKMFAYIAPDDALKIIDAVVAKTKR